MASPPPCSPSAGAASTTYAAMTCSYRRASRPPSVPTEASSRLLHPETTTVLVALIAARHGSGLGHYPDPESGLRQCCRVRGDPVAHRQGQQVAAGAVARV